MAFWDYFGPIASIYSLGSNIYNMIEASKEEGREEDKKAEAEKEADLEEQKREDFRRQFLMGLADPGGRQVDITAGIGEGESFRRGGRTLTQLGETVQELGPDMNPDDLYWLINAGGGLDAVFEPEAVPEPEDTVDEQTLGLVWDLMRNQGFMPDTLRESGLFPEGSAEAEIALLMSDPELVDALLMPAEVTPEGPTPAGLMGGYGVTWDQATGQYGFQPIPGTEAAARPSGGGAGAGVEGLIPLPALNETGPIGGAEAGYGDPVWDGPTMQYWHQNLDTGEWEPQIQMPEEAATGADAANDIDRIILDAVETMRGFSEVLTEIEALIGRELTSDEMEILRTDLGYSRNEEGAWERVASSIRRKVD